MHIINTRPAERAGKLTQDLTQLGYQVLEFPLLALQALSLDDALIQQYQAFLAVQYVVVVSPIAVELGMQYYQQLGYSSAQLQQKKWIAVGQSTQKALLQYGIESDCPNVETSEGMLQLPSLQHCVGQIIAFWRGIGGRTFMMTQLQHQGCKIVNMLLYQRRLPDHEPSYLTQLFTVLPAMVLISSEESWNNWVSLYQQRQVSVQQPIVNTNINTVAERMVENIYVVLGGRVTAVIQSYFMQYALAAKLVTVTHLDAETIHQQLQQYFQ